MYRLLLVLLRQGEIRLVATVDIPERNTVGTIYKSRVHSDQEDLAVESRTLIGTNVLQSRDRYTTPPFKLTTKARKKVEDERHDQRMWWSKEGHGRRQACQRRNRDSGLGW